MSIRGSLLALALLAAPVSVHAQDASLGGCEPEGPTPSFLSAANEIYYGCGWLFRSKPPQYFQAIGRFKSALEKEPDNATALYLLGTAYAAYGQPDSARAALRRAVQLDPTVERRLAKRFAESPSLASKVAEVLNPAPATPAAAPAAAPATAPRTPAAPAPERAAKPAPAFNPGDLVDVRVAGSDWRPGTVVSVEDAYGDGSRYLFMVRSLVVQRNPATETVTRVYPQDIRPRSTTAAPAPTGPAVGGPLVTGAYACEHVTFSPQRGRQSTSKGSLTMRADGSYRLYDNGESGRYRYDARSGAITWVSGPVADMQPERTVFKRGRTTAEVLITMKGVYEWSCGRTLP